MRVVIRSGNQLRVEQLMNVRLASVYATTDRPFNMRQFILLLLHLLNLHLLNVLSDLLCKQIFQLVTYLVPGVKLLRQGVGVVTFADEYVLASPFTDFDRQSQDFLALSGRDSGTMLASGFRCPSRRALLVLSLLHLELLLLLLLLKLLLLLLGQAFKVVSLDIIQIARQAQRLKELLLRLHLVLRLVENWVAPLSAPSLISVMLQGHGIVTVSTDGHLVADVASNASIIVRICLFDTCLVTFAYWVVCSGLVANVFFVVWLAE